MHDRSAAPKSLARALPELESYGRDLRIDACRGIALWCIFLDHVPNNIGSWLTLRNYGFSDAAEVFMFLSGLTCALSYGKARQHGGWAGAIRRTLWRSWDIYAAFLLLTLASAVMVHLAGGQLADQTNTRILLQQPGITLAHAAILQYRPVNTDILPLFALFHLLFAPLLWLLLRAPNATLGASLLLYTLANVFGWIIPAWPTGHWYFNPLTWQLPLVLGAWWIIEGNRFRPWVTSRTALVPAVLFLAFSLVTALSWNIKPQEEALVPQALLTQLYPMDKSNLAPWRLLHFLSLAVVAAWLVPRNWQGLTTMVARGAILCGQNSLPIYCLGVLLSLASYLTLLDISDRLTMQLALSIAGVLAMTVAAALLNATKTKPGRRPDPKPIDIPVEQPPAYGLVINLQTVKALGVLPSTPSPSAYTFASSAKNVVQDVKLTTKTPAPASYPPAIPRETRP